MLIRMKRFLWLLVGLLTSNGPLLAAIAEASERKPPVGADLFSEASIPQLEIELSEANTERLRQRPRSYVLATIREGNTTYTNVSIRLKGGPGSSRPFDDKPAFTVNFERQAPGQRFHGLKKIHLNNSVQDHSYLGEKISRELFAAAGVPAPRAGHAWVEVNGRNLGFYVLIEGINKQFLKRYFSDPTGNLYDGHSQSEVNRRMRTNSGENREDHSGLRALAAAAQEPVLATRLAALEKALDVDEFLSFLATEIMLCHWDGYAMNRNNFRVYHDRDRNRCVFIPQGTDQVFQRPNTSIFTGMAGLVAKSALEIPELRERYRQRASQLLTNVWQIGPLTNHIYEVGAKIRESMALHDSSTAASYMPRVTAFSRRVQQRVRILQRELVLPSAEARFDNSGLLSVTDWQPQTDLGSATLTKEPGPQQSVALHIRAQEPCAASWRSRVQLEKGRYRFHGRMRWQGVELDPQDPKDGVGLRVSRRKFARAISGDAPWTTVAFDFEVTEDRADVELVCELRATAGDAWFDQGSLRLIRQE